MGRIRRDNASITDQRGEAIQDQIDTIMDSFDFSAVVQGQTGNDARNGEKQLRQIARKVLHTAAGSGGWATGGGFSAFIQEKTRGRGEGEVKLILFFGPTSLFEPCTKYGPDGVFRAEV